MNDNSNRIRPGRPGFTLYFDQVDAIKRLASKNPTQGLNFFLALAEYARDGSLPEDPFIDLALSGHMHQIEADCAKYWRQIDGSHEGGRRSAEKRKSHEEQTAKEAPEAAAVITSAAPQEIPFTFIKTKDGQKPVFLSKLQQFEHLLVDEYDLQNAVLAYADDVNQGSEATPQGGDAMFIAVGFREWAKGNGLFKHS